MKKAIVSILVLVFLASSALSEQAVYTEGEFVYRLTERGAVLDDWINWTDSETQPTLIVPESLGGIPVVGISPSAFETCHGGPYSSGFELVIPEGVVFLEPYAFECLSNATVIYLPSTLETIPEGSFIHVGADIVFPNGNPYFTMENGFLIDQRTQTLLYSTLSSAGESLPAVARLGDFSIENWVFDKTEVVLPDSLVSIGTSVFYDLPDLTSVTLPDTLTRMDSNCFFATALKEITIPPTLKEIPYSCFYDCALTSIHIPSGVERIGEYAFYYNWDLTEVTLPETVEFVGYNAFPEECSIIALNPDTHFETLEEYQIRDPNGEWWE